ncbi:cytidine deaminase [Chloroflexota bacterium]
MIEITDDLKEKLVQAAIDVRQWAYAPYSRYRVGAALLADSGEIYDGVNVENAAYPTGTCAERAAIFTAVSQGERHFSAIAVVSSNGGAPCGACRQVLAEFGLDTIVFVADDQGRIQQETTVNELLPGAFGPGDLPGFEATNLE